MVRGGIEIHNGKVVIPYIKGALDLYLVAGQVFNVEKEGGIDEQYFAGRFKATSTDNIALENRWMAGVIAEAAFTEGSITGALSRFSCVHGYMQLGQALGAGVISALATFQVAPGTTQVVDAGVEVLPSGFTIDRLWSLRGGNVNYVLGFTDLVAGVINKDDVGETGTKAGYLKCKVHDADLFLRLYTTGV